VLSGQAASTELLARARREKRLVIFDYDGTLADLGVDWEAVRRSLSSVGRRYGFESSFRPLWKEVARAKATAGDEAVREMFRALAVHERDAVATQKPRSDMVTQARTLIADDAGPLCGVFSVNLHETVVTGLGSLRLEGVQDIVGADDVNHWKPDPEGLHILMNRSKSSPECTLFVGDSKGDEQAAQAAGIDFLWA
jgi:phosphoglycolate phosphatase-like HAD superfamily hydrolase